MRRAKKSSAAYLLSLQYYPRGLDAQIKRCIIYFARLNAAWLPANVYQAPEHQSCASGMQIS
jgi:hypothetical protein